LKKVSIIVVNWNGKRFLAECFDSLRKQVYQPTAIILVDNGSKDGSVSFVKKNYPEVTVITLSHNHGFCSANNLAIKTVNTEYVALLNNDAVAHPMWLSELINRLQRHPEAGSAASKMLFYDKPDIIDRAGDGYTTFATGLLRGRNRPAAQFNTPEYIFGACAGAALYRTQMLTDVSLFDEDFFLVYEDVDLSFRAQLKGYKCIYVPDAIVYHKGSSSIGHDSSMSVYYSQRNMEWVYIKNIPTGLIPKTLIHHLIYDIAAFFYFASIGMTRAFIKAKWDAFRHMKKILAKRNIIQKHKRADNNYIFHQMDNERLLERLKNKLSKPNMR